MVVSVVNPNDLKGLVVNPSTSQLPVQGTNLVHPDDVKNNLVIDNPPINSNQVSQSSQYEPSQTILKGGVQQNVGQNILDQGIKAVTGSFSNLASIPYNLVKQTGETVQNIGKNPKLLEDLPSTITEGAGNAVPSLVQGIINSPTDITRSITGNDLYKPVNIPNYTDLMNWISSFGGQQGIDMRQQQVANENQLPIANTAGQMLALGPVFSKLNPLQAAGLGAATTQGDIGTRLSGAGTIGLLHNAPKVATAGIKFRGEKVGGINPNSINTAITNPDIFKGAFGTNERQNAQQNIIDKVIRANNNIRDTGNDYIDMENKINKGVEKIKDKAEIDKEKILKTMEGEYDIDPEDITKIIQQEVQKEVGGVSGEPRYIARADAFLMESEASNIGDSIIEGMTNARSVHNFKKDIWNRINSFDKPNQESKFLLAVGNRVNELIKNKYPQYKKVMDIENNLINKTEAAGGENLAGKLKRSANNEPDSIKYKKSLKDLNDILPDGHKFYDDLKILHEKDKLYNKVHDLAKDLVKNPTHLPLDKNEMKYIEKLNNSSGSNFLQDIINYKTREEFEKWGSGKTHGVFPQFGHAGLGIWSVIHALRYPNPISIGIAAGLTGSALAHSPIAYKTAIRVGKTANKVMTPTKNMSPLLNEIINQKKENK